MQELIPRAEKIARVLKERNETEPVEPVTEDASEAEAAP